ncbi:hypothetical protein [Embleya sp. NPDC001921]
MLNAAEASMDQTAEDDAERARNRMRLYAPPKGMQPRDRNGRRVRSPGMGVTRAQSQALMQQVAAQDAQFAGRRTS